jgi:membrane associated rhomboid family serine protease
VLPVGWLDRLERKFGRYAVKNLMTYIVVLNALAFMLMYVDPSGNYIGKIVLDPELVLKGQVWRLVTYIFIPPATSFLWIIFALYFYYIVGSALENEWGSFRFNIYYLIGMAVTTAASFITGAPATASYLNLSLFLAFARIHPDYQLLLFFILPVKVKYLGWLNLAFLAYTVFNPSVPISA